MPKDFLKTPFAEHGEYIRGLTTIADLVEKGLISIEEAERISHESDEYIASCPWARLTVLYHNVISPSLRAAISRRQLDLDRATRSSTDVFKRVEQGLKNSHFFVLKDARNRVQLLVHWLNQEVQIGNEKYPVPKRALPVIRQALVCCLEALSVRFSQARVKVELGWTTGAKGRQTIASVFIPRRYVYDMLFRKAPDSKDDIDFLPLIAASTRD